MSSEFLFDYYVPEQGDALDGAGLVGDSAVLSTGRSERNSDRQKRQPLEIIVDYERADHVLGTLLELYGNNEYPYNLETTQVPHHPNNMPKTMPRNGKEHAAFLWNSCYYMRGGIKSVEAFRRLSNMYDDPASRDLFDLHYAKDSDVGEVVTALKKHGLGFRGTVSGQWIENARRMVDLYDGDPRNIFDGVEDYDEALLRIQNDHKGGGFKGFQHKMTSMIIYYLIDDKLIDNIDNFPIPVDLHVMRMSVANEMIKFPGAELDENLFQPETTLTLRDLFVDYANRHAVSPIKICNAVWLYSEALCGYQPGNITLEPRGRDARNGRKTELVPLEYDPLDDAQRKAFARTCGRCALNAVCKWNVPGKPYYVSGELIRRGERQGYPGDPTLF